MAVSPRPHGRRPRVPDEVRELRPAPRGRKYERATVDEFLNDLLADYETLWNEREEATSRLDEARRELERYRVLEERASSALRLAETTTALSGETEAEELKERMRVEAEEIVAQVQTQAAQIVAEARKEHERVAADVERLKEVRAEFEASFRALLLAAVEMLERGGKPDESVEIVEDVAPKPP